MKNKKNERGAITIIALVTMLFLVSFLVGTYVIAANRLQTQKEIIEEIREIYKQKQSVKDIYNSYFKESTEILIYTKEQYLKIGTSEFIKSEKDNKYYMFSPESTYVLMNEFKISENELPSEWEPPEYKFYNVNYNGNKVIVSYSDKTEMYDGEIKKVLNIADGNIEISDIGYKITGKTIIEENYTGTYVITGTTTTNRVKISKRSADKTYNYNIIIRDLNIDLSSVNNTCPFIACPSKLGANVKIILEGENILIGGGNGAGLGFANATPNVDGETRGSTLIIEGEGSLFAEGGKYSAGIGTGYTGTNSSAGEANNIIINSGNITAKGTGHGAGIGAGFGKKANNIVINGGNIIADGDFFEAGIGGSSGNVSINGGNIFVTDTNYKGMYSSGIVGGVISITGGKITTIEYGQSSNATYRKVAIGPNAKKIIIEGGTLSCKSIANAGIFSASEGVIITGGNILSEGLGDIGTLDENSNFIKGTAIKENGINVYLTKLQIQDVEKDKKIIDFTTSDDILYGINEMYTLDNGMLYVYLPEGTRTISVIIDGIIYSGIITTDEQNTQGIQQLYMET